MKYEKNDNFLFINFVIILSFIGCLFDIYGIFDTISTDIEQKISELPEFLATDGNIEYIRGLYFYKSFDLFFNIFGLALIIYSLFLMLKKKYFGFQVYVLGQVCQYFTNLLVIDKFVNSVFIYGLIFPVCMIVIYYLNRNSLTQ